VHLLVIHCKYLQNVRFMTCWQFISVH